LRGSGVESHPVGSVEELADIVARYRVDGGEEPRQVDGLSCRLALGRGQLVAVGVPQMEAIPNVGVFVRGVETPGVAEQGDVLLFA